MFDFSGMINTDGVYLSNDSGFEKDARDYMFYEMEFDADLKITPSDKTLIFLNMEIHDETFTASPTDSGGKTGDDNIAFKRAYGKYTFDNGMSTQFGLMTGGAFGTAFGDSGDGTYRVRLDGKASFGAWGVILEKGSELGTEGRTDAVAPLEDWDAEKDDTDSYYAYWVGKFGQTTVPILVGFRQYGDFSGGAVEGGLEFEDPDVNLMFISANAMGSAGSLGYEAEFIYQDFTAEFKGGDDWAVYGLYGNLWMTMDAMKVGGYAAYGSWDDDTGRGFNFGADFYFGEGVGESQSFGTSNNGGFAAVTLLGLYGDYAVNDALSLYGNLSYWMSNEDELADGSDSPYKDSDGYELTGRLAYNLADNVTYSAGIAYGEFKPDKGSVDPYARAFHKIQINF
jgi:hypothetical protein